MDRQHALVVVVGDLHTNSTVALSRPRVPLDDGGEYVASKLQRWIWRRWSAFWNEVAEVQQRLGFPTFLIFNGEIADDNRHATTQLITRNEADQMRHAVQVLEPALALEPDGIFVTRGTEAHVHANASMDEQIADDIGAIRTDADTASWWNLRAELGGVLFDVAHHPGTGHARPWTRGGDANRVAAMITYEYAAQRRPVPHLTIRGHNHKPADSGDNHPTRAIIMPSWQLNTSFGYRIGGGTLPVGGMWVVCEGGNFEVHKRVWQWPIQRPWKVSNLQNQS